MYTKKNPIIFLLSGKAESGKNEIADIIENLYSTKKVKKLSYAYYLKEYVKDISSWDGSEDTKPRTLLQDFGISFLKQKIDSNLLIRRTCEDIEVYSYFYDIIIVTDARLKDELEVPKKMFQNIYSIRIIRNENTSKLSDEQKKHYTEVDLDDYNKFDYVVYNDENVKESIEKIVGEISNEK